MTDKETRAARILAHQHFDRIWKPLGKSWRGIAYKWLSLHVRSDDPHMGSMTKEEAEEVVAICEVMSSRALKAWHEEHLSYFEGDRKSPP